jgi:DNA-directed RNA polymerase subunit RPC12/RpoP
MATPADLQCPHCRETRLIEPVDRQPGVYFCAVCAKTFRVAEG